MQPAGSGAGDHRQHAAARTDPASTPAAAGLFDQAREPELPPAPIKDRIGLSDDRGRRSVPVGPAARAASRRHAPIIEATVAGSTGLGLALVAAQKGLSPTAGHRADKMSQEKILHLRALGAQSPPDAQRCAEGPSGALPRRLRAWRARLPNSYYVDQFANPANPLAHEATTGPEIWAQMGQMLDAMVVGRRQRRNAHGTVALLRASRAACRDGARGSQGFGAGRPRQYRGKLRKPAGSWLVEGIGEDFVPPNCDLSRVRRAYEICDADSFYTATACAARQGRPSRAARAPAPCSRRRCAIAVSRACRSAW